MPRTLLPILMLCGLLGSSAVPVLAQAPGPAGATPPVGQVNCSALAANPKSPMSADLCRQMTNTARQAEAATKDARGARPGDDAMTCADIEREMGTMRGGLSDASRAEGSAATAQYGAVMGSQMAKIQAEGAAATAATTAAAAADLATQFATGGLVNPHTAAIVQQVAQAHSLAEGERMGQERRPAEQRLLEAVGNNTQEMTQQLQANPRLARLVSLAMAKQCQGDDEAPASAPVQAQSRMPAPSH